MMNNKYCTIKKESQIWSAVLSTNFIDLYQLVDKSY
jgi:hypothetical protein